MTLARTPRSTARQRDARVKRRRGAARRELQDAARAVLLRAGVAGLTLEAVAREAGVTKQGLLYHFASKEELVFEILLETWERDAKEIAAAVEPAASAGDALEAIIRTYVQRYAGELDLFRLVMQQVQLYDTKSLVGTAQLARIRPLNDQLYGGAERKVREELATRKTRRPAGAGPAPVAVDPRRIAFCAHVAAVGIVAIKALVERFGDPLLHTDEELITQMGAVFRAAITHGGTR